jgi:hypothetical protein
MGSPPFTSASRPLAAALCARPTFSPCRTPTATLPTASAVIATTERAAVSADESTKAEAPLGAHLAATTSASRPRALPRLRWRPR